MARPLRHHRRPPPLGDRLVVGPAAQRAAQVALLAGEQAVADLAVGGQPDPVAVAAEGPGDRRDDAHGPRPAVDREQLGGGPAPPAPPPPPHQTPPPPGGGTLRGGAAPPRA